MVSEPVTLGGGIEITYGSRVPGAEPARNTPRSSQNAYHRDSTSVGS